MCGRHGRWSRRRRIEDLLGKSFEVAKDSK
jgi:hypothetical protein